MFVGRQNVDPYEQVGRSLMEAKVPVLSFRACQDVGEKYRSYLQEESHMCAGNATSLSPSADACPVRILQNS